MNILITNLENHISQRLYDLYQNNKTNIKFINKLDDKKTIEKTIKKSNPDLIIHLDKIWDIEKCTNNNITMIQNVTESKILIDISKKHNVPLAYISTAEVYGESSNIPFTEGDSLKPINKLGLMNKEIEAFIRKNLSKHFILRTSWIFGTSNCYVKQIITNAKTPVFFCNSKIVNPTSITYIFNAINSLSTSTNYGTYNCSTYDYCSKVDFTKFIFRILDVSKDIQLIPDAIKKTLTPSSEFCALDTSLLYQNTGIKSSDWKTELLHYIENDLMTL